MNTGRYGSRDPNLTLQFFCFGGEWCLGERMARRDLIQRLKMMVATDGVEPPTPAFQGCDQQA
jgi:hypothetical protein